MKLQTIAPTTVGVWLICASAAFSQDAIQPGLSCQAVFFTQITGLSRPSPAGVSVASSGMTLVSCPVVRQNATDAVPVDADVFVKDGNNNASDAGIECWFFISDFNGTGKISSYNPGTSNSFVGYQTLDFNFTGSHYGVYSLWSIECELPALDTGGVESSVMGYKVNE